MFRRLSYALVLASLVVGLAGPAVIAYADSPSPSFMPPSPALMKALIKRGVIPADASQDQAEQYLQGYLKAKLGQKPEDRPNPLGREAIATGEKTGKPQNNHGRIMRPDNKRFDNVLVLLVEFTDPVHNQLPPPVSPNNTDFWVSDFNRQHYQQMLFSRSPGAKSMANYYLEQSGGVYTVDGVVYGWVKVNMPESWYGADGTGIDDLNGPVWRVVGDAVLAAGDTIPWARFDQEDPYDLDGDGNFAEPDGYVDHIQLVHAGAGQEAGGGAQGDNAIWSHSWWADFNPGAGPGYGGVPTSDPNVFVGPYTIQPEDGAIGVFAHEFGHDLGLPDLYDTLYSGEASTAFWTLMSGGSWLSLPGEPLGTSPANMGMWEKYVLGWADPVVVNPGQIVNNILLKQAESAGPANKGVRVNLPNYSYTISINTPKSGSYEWWSGQGDRIDNTLVRSVALPSGSSATLSIWTWYKIEKDWDYGYVQVSTDSGLTWVNLPSTITTNTDPHGNNKGNGITGNSPGWVQASFDLTPYCGNSILLRFEYVTDEAIYYEGWTLDDLSIAVDGNVVFSDGAEGGPNGWTAKGWSIISGTVEKTARHYYMAEWREFAGFDRSLAGAYNFPSLADYLVGYAERFSYNPGMLLWYRNMRYGNNWVGVHPGGGMLLVVDSHPAPLLRANGILWRTRVQVQDATFGLKPTISNTLTSFGTSMAYPSLPGVSVFDDSNKYYNLARPDQSVITPHYGLKITVRKHDPNSGQINVDFGTVLP